MPEQLDVGLLHGFVSVLRFLHEHATRAARDLQRPSDPPRLRVLDFRIESGHRNSVLKGKSKRVGPLARTDPHGGKDERSLPCLLF